MEIVIVIDSWNKGNGGVVVTHTLVKELQQRGHEISLVTTSGEEASKYNGTVNEIAGFYLPGIKESLKSMGFRFGIGQKKVYRKAFKGADLVHVVFPFFMSRNAARVAHKMKIPVMGACHIQSQNLTGSMGKDNKTLDWFFNNWFNFQLFNRVSAIHCNSEHAADMPVIQNVWVDGDVEENAIIITECRVRNHFPETYRFQLLDGEFSTGESETDTGKFLVNESACEALGLLEPVGSVINVHNHRDTVIGVLRDFHFRSLHNPIEPLVISRYHPLYRHISIRSESDSLNWLMQDIDSLMRVYLPGHELIMYPLGKLHEQMYLDEDKQAMLYSGGALLAIVIGIFGLFALTTYTSVRRTKEIGIRKTMGGSRMNIFFLLGGSIIKWILISALIATPLAWFAVNEWLQRFYYHINYAWLLIIVSIIVSIGIAMLTITCHILKITRKNPVDSLRYE